VSAQECHRRDLGNVFECSEVDSMVRRMVLVTALEELSMDILALELVVKALAEGHEVVDMGLLISMGGQLAVPSAGMILFPSLDMESVHPSLQTKSEAPSSSFCVKRARRMF